MQGPNKVDGENWMINDPSTQGLNLKDAQGGMTRNKR